MFTGIIQEIGVIEKRRATSLGSSFVVNAPITSHRLSPGDSVAVNGVCQTVEMIDGECFGFTAVGETLRRTTLDSLTGATRVNLEPAATLATAMGGHLVQGHVDGVGRVESVASEDQDRLLKVRLPEGLADLAVEKGSITIDGVSLTIVETGAGDLVTITIVPFTVERTIVGSYRHGTRVNVEADIIGKYVKAYLLGMNSAGPARDRSVPHQEEM